MTKWLLGGAGAVALALTLWFWLPHGKGPDLKADIGKIDTVVTEKKEADKQLSELAKTISALTAGIAQDREEAAKREKAALARQAKADQDAQESARLKVRVDTLESLWGAFRSPQSLLEAKAQLTTAADLIQTYRKELQAKDSEILDLRLAIQELTAADQAKERAIAKEEGREEERVKGDAIRKEMMDRMETVLTGIRLDLKEERAQRAREKWLSLIPVVGAVLLLFGAHLAP